MDTNPNPIEKDPSIYTYWKHIPNVKLLSQQDFNKLKQDVRQAINRVLKEGVDDLDPGTGKMVKRHVMNAKEIFELVLPMVDQSLTVSNLYFHLNTLEEAGIIDIVVNLGKGTEIAAYYGKTAKHYLLSDTTEKPQLELLSKPKFKEMIREISPNASETLIIETLQTISDIQFNKRDSVLQWLDTNEQFLQAHDINFAEFFNLINFLKIDDPRIFRSIITLSKLLKINI